MRVSTSFWYVAGASLATALLLYLDATGFFIYFGYRLAWAATIGWAVLGFMMFRSKRIGRSAYLIPVIAMAIVAAVSPSFRTSGRKGFYLDALSLRPGMSVSSVTERMNGYEVFDKYEGTMTFTYKSNDSTIDTVRVFVSSNGQDVLSVEYSPD